MTTRTTRRPAARSLDDDEPQGAVAFDDGRDGDEEQGEEEDGEDGEWQEDEPLPFDLSRFPNADEIDRYPLDGCMLGRKVDPGTGKVLKKGWAAFEGQSIWVLPYSPAGLDNALMAFFSHVASIEQAAKSRDQSMPDANIQAIFKAMKRGLSRVVVGWNVIEPGTDTPFPQPYLDTGVFDDVPSELLYFIAQTIRTGEVPGDRPNASTGGRAGRGTRSSSAPTTRGTNAGRRRR